MPPKIGYSYLRFSTPEQAEGHSLARQIKDTEDWAKQNGVTLDTSLNLQDLGVSAFTSMHRDNPDKFALASFVEQVEQGKIAPDCYLIVENIDRLTREHLRPAIVFFLRLLDSKINIVTTSPEKVYLHTSNDMIDIIVAVIELARGHRESARKSEMVGKAWQQKKADAVKDRKPLTAMCPHWLRVEDGRYVEIPERVALVRRIFRETIDGCGVGALCRKLNKEGVQPWQQVRRKKDRGKPHLWQKSSVARILGNRAVLGEYQPHVGHRDRKAVGDPVPNFYPVIITEGEFYEAQDGLEGRRKVGVVERSVGTNLFSGLVQADDGCSWVYHNKGKTQDSTLARSDGLNGGQPYVSVSYRVFERVVLESLREISPTELMPGDRRAEVARLAEVQGKLVAVDGRIAEITAKLSDPEFKGLDAMYKALGNLNVEKERLQGEYQEARRALASPVVEGVGEAQTLIDLLKANPSQEIRQRLRAKIRSVVSGMLFTVQQRRGLRFGWVQIRFHRTGYVRNILFAHLLRRKSLNFERPEVVHVELIHEPPVKDAKFNGKLLDQMEDVIKFESLVATGDKEQIKAELDRLDKKWGIREDMLKRGYVPADPEEIEKVKKLKTKK